MITQTKKKNKVPYQEQPNLEFQKRVVELYDSSFMMSYNSVAQMVKRTPQRIAQIHKAYPHDCPRKKLEGLK